MIDADFQFDDCFNFQLFALALGGSWKIFLFPFVGSFHIHIYLFSVKCTWLVWFLHWDNESPNVIPFIPI